MDVDDASDRSPLPGPLDIFKKLRGVVQNGVKFFAAAARVHRVRRGPFGAVLGDAGLIPKPPRPSTSPPAGNQT